MQIQVVQQGELDQYFQLVDLLNGLIYSVLNAYIFKTSVANTNNKIEIRNNLRKDKLKNGIQEIKITVDYK